LYLKHKETLKNINNYISIRQFIKNLISFWETCLYLKHKETLKNINNYISIRQFIKIYIKYFLLFLEIFFEIFKLDILLLYNCNSAKF